MKDCIPKISVIVPCYNVEKFVSKCIDSILCQSLQNIEVILLNDGSTDNTMQILQEFSSTDKRIRLYSHDNIGLGPTRNRGIGLAQGEYLAFVDSDDYISQYMLEKLYKVAVEEKAEIVEGETVLFNEDGDKKLRKSLRNVESVKLECGKRESFYRDYYLTRLYTYNAWDKIYKREFIVNNNIIFGDNKKIFAEDNWFQLQLFMAHPQISFMDEECYFYRQQEDSIMHKPKANLISRHGAMISDYKKLIQDSDCVADKQLGGLLAMDIFTMVVLDSNVAGDCRRQFVRYVSEVEKNSVLKNEIKQVGKNKAWILEKNTRKQLYYKMLSGLYNMKLYNLCYAFIWILYKDR